MYHSKEGLITEAKIKTGVEEFRVKKVGHILFIGVKSRPEQGRANQEIVKELGRLLGKRVEILKGHRNSKKLILIRDASEEDISHFQ